MSVRHLAAAALAASVLLAGCSPYQTNLSWSGYASEQTSMGRLRTERAPADARFTNADLARNFEIIAFDFEDLDDFLGDEEDEPLRKGLLRKWTGPIRWGVWSYSPSAESQEARVAEFLNRLAAITGLDIAPAGDGEENLTVYFVEDTLYETAATLTPENEYEEWLAARIDKFGRFHASPCNATTFSTNGDDPENPVGTVTAADVFILSGLEEPLAQSCIEEELAQSLGLLDDDDHVRPSIFNDDAEFAYLTDHDEWLIRILYDPRLEPGMTPAEAMPIVRRILAEERTAGEAPDDALQPDG